MPRRRCPPGMILRRSYRRRDGSRVRGSRVAAVCIRDLGKKGHGPKILPKPTSGALRRFKYSTKKKPTARRRSLRRAVRSYGYQDTVAHLNLIRNLTRRSQPRNSAKYTEDMEWLKKTYRPALTKK